MVFMNKLLGVQKELRMSFLDLQLAQQQHIKFISQLLVQKDKEEDGILIRLLKLVKVVSQLRVTII